MTHYGIEPVPGPTRLPADRSWPPGAYVTYHGSLPQLEGTRLRVIGPCGCPQCPATDGIARLSARVLASGGTAFHIRPTSLRATIPPATAHR